MMDQNWNDTPGDIAGDIRKLVESVKSRTGYDPDLPRTVIVSPSRYQWLIDNGWINPDGSVTEKFTKEFGTDFTAVEAVPSLMWNPEN